MLVRKTLSAISIGRGRRGVDKPLAVFEGVFSEALGIKGVVFKEFKAEALVKCCQDCNVLLGRSPIKYPG